MPKSASNRKPKKKRSVRIKIREAKRRERASLTEEQWKELRARDKARCATLTVLERYITHESAGDDCCWLWDGPWRAVGTTVYPIVRAGQYGEMFADRAMWIATRGRPVQRGAWPARVCGRKECVAPHHLYEENRMTARARRRLANMPPELDLASE